MAQTVKNLPPVPETQAQSLSWEEPLEREMATHCSILAWRIPWTEQPGGLPEGKLRPWGLSKESDTTEQLNTSTFSNDLLPIF